MQKLLVICANEAILATILRLISNSQEWQAEGALNKEEALLLLQHQDFSGVIIGSGLNGAEEKSLIQSIRKKNKQTIIIPHYGGGSGLLYNEIRDAFRQVTS